MGRTVADAVNSSQPPQAAGVDIDHTVETVEAVSLRWTSVHHGVTHCPQ